MKKLFSFLLIFLLLPLSAFSHSGRTDKYGGHNNRKTGGYHYHNPGKVHDADNPYQDHTKCGICDTSVKSGDTLSSHKDIKAIQTKLKELELFTGSVLTQMRVFDKIIMKRQI